jgi:hypothetical protein
MTQKIAICCNHPLVSTMLFSGAEYFCMKCGTKYGMLEAERVDVTPELAAAKDSIEAHFKELTQAIVPWKSYRVDCLQCSKPDGTREYHWLHMTPEEKRASNKAVDDLMAISRGG